MIRLTRYLEQDDPFLTEILNQIAKDYSDEVYIDDNKLIKPVRKYAVFVTDSYYNRCKSWVLENCRLKQKHPKELGRYGKDQQVDTRKDILK